MPVKTLGLMSKIEPNNFEGSKRMRPKSDSVPKGHQNPKETFTSVLKNLNFTGSQRV